MQLKYSAIEEQLTEALPEIRPAAEYYWSTQGKPGKDCGPYIFFEDVFGSYVEVLLAIPRSIRRDELLKRAFTFVEEMLASSGEVANLAFIGLFEGRPAWWFRQATEFIGPRAVQELNRFAPYWRNTREGQGPASQEIIDLYGVRRVIASELSAEGITVDDLPGNTYMDGAKQ
jgi:hypothetical protein